MTPAPVIIAIDGRSGAGKTTLAVELAARLRMHHKVSLFHLEDIYPGWNGLAAGIERYVTTVLAPLRHGDAAEWVSWDWEKHYDGRNHVTLPAEIVIVEGVGAAANAARPMLDAVVWVDAPDDDRRHRAMARDGSSYEPFWDSWAAQEDEWLETDDVLDHTDVRVLNRADGNAPDDSLQALNYLPSLSPVLAPELSARRGLQLKAERIDATPDAAALFHTLYAHSANAVWLDSSNTSSNRDTVGDAGSSNAAAERSRFSILADDGGSFGQAVTHSSGTTRLSAGCATVETTGPFFRWLDTVWGRKALKAPEGYDCEFTLGWLGYLGYELKRETGGSDVQAGTPDAALLFAGRAVVIDHREAAVWLLAIDTPDAGEWLGLAREAVLSAASAPQAASAPRHSAGDPAVGGRTLALEFSSRDTEDEYKSKISDAQHQIAEGNTYEVCLTTTVTATDPGLDPWEGYLALRKRNPAPFASYLRFGDLTVASTSPERFLRITSDGGMRAEPIKGTRGRANDPVLDEALRRGLESSLKDRAENIMIVDLLRNDLSHFAVPGSVTVSRLCAVESYATVHQMVSTIDARLRPGAPRAEAVAAAFPAGSMTGAPKISTMDILDGLESGPRGVYSGAIGYFSLNAATDLAVVIRTLVMGPDGDGGRTLSLGVGGAITADSTPQDEYEEIRTKAFGVLSALGAEFPST
ncbi:aminodeoxychorismate synthase component I [Arthrobacter bambusae]|uniref:aminodeoxychorismate synthase component I n=1 Tax=Arthrobacter bambusae TaxID=1338426 RepID=UPI00277F7E6D|nr:aminodeoxychorismate synthase component I [Arthrobacter bambusae]MDQ0210649.1 anthranilate synthase component 1/para-aminobenzoate synthetase [Arthrobacter bambusae]MDQ0235321.1 anthranilate synthase component 1/para-aminobenzoate synthetase [Arthrobacter bambusae]